MPKTLSQEQFEVRHAAQMEIATRELMRRSHDSIRVYNPLPQAFKFKYDGFWHTVPGKSFKDLDRYLAMKFYKNIADKMIGDQISAKGAELKKVREAQMGQQFLDHYDENVQIWDKVPKINDPDLMAQIFKTVILGVVEEYGAEEPEPDMSIPEQMTDYRSPYEQMFDSLTPVSNDTPLEIPLEELRGTANITPIEPEVYVSKADKKKLEEEVLNADQK